mgnify:CR=1 FL=1
MTYFISGHRDLTQEEFDKHYAPLIDEIIRNDVFTEFVVGDWEGCDTMFINFLLEQVDYPPITIYHVEEEPRIKYGNESILNVENIYSIKLRNYDECDAKMTKDSVFDVAWIRPGREDSHTAMNIKRRYYGKL